MKRISLILSALIFFSFASPVVGWPLQHKSPGNLRFSSVEGGISNPGTQSLRDTGEPTTDLVTSDINMDGKEEVVFGIGNSLYALNKDETLWTAHFGNSMKRATTPSIYDLPQSEGKEILLGAGNSVYLLNSTGGRIWRKDLEGSITRSPRFVENQNYIYTIVNDDPTLLNPEGKLLGKIKGFESRKTGISDLDKDNTDEIITGMGSFTLIKIPEFKRVWTREDSLYSPPLITDVDQDGGLEIIFKTNKGEIISLNFDGSVLWRSEVTNTFSLYSSVPSAADLDSDGTREIICSSSGENKVYILNGDNGNIESTFEDIYYPAEPSIVDIDGDNELEIILNSEGGRNIYSFNYNSLEWVFETENYMVTSPVLVDFDNDGKTEIAVGTEEGIEIIGNKKNKPPDAEFSPSRDSVFLGETLDFDASDSSDSDSPDENLKYRWDFQGDGEWDTPWLDKEKMNHSYFSSGNHTVKLMVKDNGGLKDNYTKEVRIFASNNPPEANFEVNMKSGTTQTNFEFTGNPEDREYPEELEIRWDFQGDGEWDTNFSDELNIEHKYEQKGTYKAKMLVRDSGGLIDSEKKKIKVENARENNKGTDDKEKSDYTWILLMILGIIVLIIFIIVILSVEKSPKERAKY